MGAKDSKRSCLSYEDAVKRMSDVERKRVREAFDRLTGGSQLLSRHAFIQHVLGDGVPLKIAEWLYLACGGGPRGIAFRDLICGLVLLTRGSEEEKIKFLWTLYCNDSGTYISRTDFIGALQTEGTLPPNGGNRNELQDATIASLFRTDPERVTFETFKEWLHHNKEATILSKWLLTKPCVSLSSEVETPTFYQTLAGVTHLEEQDICELEKCFWSLKNSSGTGELDLNCISSLVCPPIPPSACEGLFLALDVNRDGHIDFKELCCGISAACRGPTAERMKFCFKIFDLDRDGRLNRPELRHMLDTLLFVEKENKSTPPTTATMSTDDRKIEFLLGSDRFSNETDHQKLIDDLNKRLDADGALCQEEFLMWTVDENGLVAGFMELLFQVCHVSLGLKPFCRHNEHDIVTGWLKREERRGFRIGQFWYLISSEWWHSWVNYTTSPRSNYDHCNCRPSVPVEEGIVCDESFAGTEYTSHSNEFTSNSTESMGDLLSRGDSCSIASSSGVSSSSGNGLKRSQGLPGPIENSSLVAEVTSVVPTLTGEGGRLKRDTTLVQHRDFELVPDSLWKALALWYGGPLPLPRQVIRPPGSHDVELELYPLNLRILRHQSHTAPATTWNNVVGGYGGALTTAGITTNPVQSPRRTLMHTAAFSRLANIRQVIEFLCRYLCLKVEDVRLWHVRDSPVLLEDEYVTLQELGVSDNDQILLEVRNKDLTWPEELGALAAGGTRYGQSTSERRPTISLPPGATGLHNLGNTCFMNAALQAISNTRPLTQYFQRDAQLCELNSANPLGTKGQVARRYAELCRELWAGSTRSVAPLKLRWCVAKHAPHLGSGGQHDSQEMLAWLLDTLHEDLNRVSSKPYKELKDSNGRPDTEVATEAWHQHLSRDHSIITDLFYGQLKSKVTCQTCGHESVKFDPFNLLSLPLPMESYILCEVLVIRLSGETPVKYGLRLNSEARYSELKEQLEELCGISADRLLLTEVAYSQIRDVLPDEAKINVGKATEIYGYELPERKSESEGDSNHEVESENELPRSQSPLARSPEVRGSTALCMPNILCFKTARSHSTCESTASFTRPAITVTFKKPSISMSSGSSSGRSSAISDAIIKTPTYFIAVHRKCVRQESYFLSQHKSKPSLFGVPLLLGCDENSTCQSLYEAVWNQVNRLLSPMPQSDQTNHATDCDDSLGYEFPFTLKAVLQGGQICAICHWTQFCRGCSLPCTDERIFDLCNGSQVYMWIAIDWDPTALHLRYQSCREKLWIEHESVGTCRKLHTEPIDLDYCLRAFTSEEQLETMYHCSNCQEKRPATKKLQIWRLPPILIIHLKRFDCVNNKWVKTQKAVNFPFKNFDPTAYLASVPQETILRHKQLVERRRQQQEELEGSLEVAAASQSEAKIVEEERLVDVDGKLIGVGVDEEKGEERRMAQFQQKLRERNMQKARERLESTSLMKTPINDEDLKDFHEHKLIKGQDPFDLKYQLYAVVSHSGLLNGGHYISYACNPNGNWYCYNDSSCREMSTDVPAIEPSNNNDDRPSRVSSERTLQCSTGCTPLTARKNDRDGDSDGEFAAGNVGNCNRNTETFQSPLDATDASSTTNLIATATANSSLVDSDRLSTASSTIHDSRSSISGSSSIYKCPYRDVRVPKIDASSAYILFYERSGLDYRPYLPDVVPNGHALTATEVELEENEQELRKQLCCVQ